jgi:outer membrane protein OmpA-like peptidoglycan-associated protein
MLSLSATAHAQSAEAGGSLSLSTASGAEGASDASAQGAPAAPAAAEAESAPLSEEQRRARQLRAGASYFGPVGGIYVIDAGSGAPGSFRLNLTTDFFVKKDHLQKNDTNRYFGSVLALGVTPIEHLELSAAVTTRSNRNDAYTPDVVQAVGDLHFDVKGYATLTPGLHLGGDVMLSFLNDQDDAGIAFDATGVGLRANLSFDFRELADDVPLQMRVNAGYVFDNSTKTVSKLEAARFANLQANGQTRATDPSDDYYHYVDRRERLALGINRVDRVALALGLEVPLEVGDSAAIHPLAEWSFDVPVNRQDFDCPLVVDGTGKRAAGTDSCLDVEGIDTWPQHLTVGARAWPVKGLNLLAAVDIGLSGTSRYVQELAPTPPYRIILGAGYTVDARDKPPQVVVKEVEKTVEVNVAPPTGRIRGTIVEQDVNTVVADAKISFPGTDTNPVLGGADGTFVSYAFPPGNVDVDIEAEGYRAGTCTTAIPAEGGDVALTCALEALPRVGSVKGQVLGAEQAPLAAVQILLTGPEARTITTDVNGKFAEKDLKPGEYSARIEQEGYLISVTPVVIKVREESEISIALLPLPKRSSVKVQKDKIQIRGTIFFTSGTADIEARSEPLLAEIADAMIRNPEVLKVEVQGHTDDTGKADNNQDLSQRRAEAVKDWLAGAGVTRDRLLAKGYGADKPLVPNLTPQNRAKNRRVEFVILERAGEQ